MNEFKLLSSVEFLEHVTIVNDRNEWRSKNPRSSIENYMHYESRTVKTWKTLIQTPFEAKIKHSDLEKVLWNKLNDYLMSLEIVEKQTDDIGKYCNWFVMTSEGNKEVNGVYRILLKQNFSKNCWEVEIYHTLPLYTRSVLKECTINPNKVRSSFSGASEDLKTEQDIELEKFLNKYLPRER